MVDNGRTLIYTCADKIYAHWIPLYCLGMLYHNDNIDIEIGIEGELCHSDRQALIYLRKKFPNSKILIKENFFEFYGDYAIVNGIKCRVHSVRFITTPKIKDEYIYIGDIDIICMERNIFSKHIDFMKNENMCYSNIVRKSYPYGLSGLHFSLYNSHYPLPSFSNMDMMEIDEVLLKNIVIKKGIKLNESVSWRPTHGIHFSKNRPFIGGTSKIPGWGAEAYEQEWNDFTSSKEFKHLYDKSAPWIKKMIEKLNKFYNDDGSETFENIKPLIEFETIYSDKLLNEVLCNKHNDQEDICNKVFALNSTKFDKIFNQNNIIVELLKEITYTKK